MTKRYGFLVRTQTGAGPISLRRGLWCLQRCGYQVCTQNQLEAQRSGFELERRSKGEKRSFKAAPKGTALKRSGAVSLRRGAADGSRTRTPVRTQAPQACQSTNSSTAAKTIFSDRLLIIHAQEGFVKKFPRFFPRRQKKGTAAFDFENRCPLA